MDAEDAEAQDRHVEEIVIVEGVFSWFAAWMMMLWLVVTICSIAMAIMTFQGDGIERISEEISFVMQQSPPYGPAEQPALANTREINEPFRYHLPQVALFYSVAAAALGLFTVSFFANSMLLETQGTSRAVDINMLIAEGVQTYMSRTFPVIIFFLVSAGGYVYVTSGWGTLTCFGAGAFLNLISAWLGVRAGVQGTCRLATVMGENLSRSVQLGMYTGAIGGSWMDATASTTTTQTLAALVRLTRDFFKERTALMVDALLMRHHQSEEAVLRQMSWMEIAVLFQLELGSSLPIPHHSRKGTWMDATASTTTTQTLAALVRLTKDFFKELDFCFRLDMPMQRGINLLCLKVHMPLLGTLVKIKGPAYEQVAMTLARFTCRRPLRTANDFVRPLPLR